MTRGRGVRQLIAIIRAPARKPVRLRPGQRLRLGRHRANDIVLTDSAVSRFHATIEWDPDEDRPRVRDDRSANGVLVNGKAVDIQRHLTSGDVIAIGSHELSVEIHDQREAETAALLDDTHVELELFDNSSPELRGNFFERTGWHRVLVELEETGSTGTLSLTREDGGRFKVIFCQGSVVGCLGPVNRDMAALRDALEVRMGQYHFSRSLEPQEATLNASCLRLIRELAQETTTRWVRRPGERPPPG